MPQPHPLELVQIVAKAPEPGRVKTRLVPLLGSEQASEVYREMTEVVITQAIADYPVQLWCTPDIDHPFFQSCRERFGVELRVQAEGDFGKRLETALKTGLKTAQRVVLLGSDCPGITREYLARAFDALRRHEVVIGPAEDGGFVLIGTRRMLPGLLRDIPWSSGRARERTEAILQAERVDYQLLGNLWDVDRPGDLRRWRSGE